MNEIFEKGMDVISSKYQSGEYDIETACKLSVLLLERCEDILYSEADVPSKQSVIDARNAALSDFRDEDTKNLKNDNKEAKKKAEKLQNINQYNQRTADSAATNARKNDLINKADENVSTHAATAQASNTTIGNAKDLARTEQEIQSKLADQNFTGPDRDALVQQLYNIKQQKKAAEEARRQAADTKKANAAYRKDIKKAVMSQDMQKADDYSRVTGNRDLNDDVKKDLSNIAKNQKIINKEANKAFHNQAAARKDYNNKMNEVNAAISAGEQNMKNMSDEAKRLRKDYKNDKNQETANAHNEIVDAMANQKENLNMMYSGKSMVKNSLNANKQDVRSIHDSMRKAEADNQRLTNQVLDKGRAVIASKAINPNNGEAYGDNELQRWYKTHLKKYDTSEKKIADLTVDMLQKDITEYEDEIARIKASKDNAKDKMARINALKTDIANTKKLIGIKKKEIHTNKELYKRKGDANDTNQGLVGNLDVNANYAKKLDDLNSKTNAKYNAAMIRSKTSDEKNSLKQQHAAELELNKKLASNTAYKKAHVSTNRLEEIANGRMPKKNPIDEAKKNALIAEYKKSLKQAELNLAPVERKFEKIPYEERKDPENKELFEKYYFLKKKVDAYKEQIEALSKNRINLDAV